MNDSQNIKELLEHAGISDRDADLFFDRYVDGDDVRLSSLLMWWECRRRVVAYLEKLEVYNIESPKNVQDPRYNGPI